MKKTKPSLFRKLLDRFRAWNFERKQAILNKMIVYNMDEAIRLANRKRDIMNHRCWVVAGAGLYLVFLRYQKQGLQRDGLLKPEIDFLELDKLASYIANPVTEKDKRRGGLLRIWKGLKASV